MLLPGEPGRCGRLQQPGWLHDEASSCLALVLAQTAVSLLLQKKGGELDERVCQQFWLMSHYLGFIPD